MFGSRARDESDDGSDVDLLVVCDAAVLPKALKDCLVQRYGESVDVAHYSYRGLEMLVEQRSLFAWHLRHEGVPIYRRIDRLRTMLADMRPYTGHSQDLDVLLTVFDEAMASLGKGRGAVQFDLGVVGTVIRNTGIIMHDLLGSRDFSPAAPIRLASVAAAPALPIGADLYELLGACRRASERGARIQGGALVPVDKLIAALESVRPWLYSCIRSAKASEE